MSRGMEREREGGGGSFDLVELGEGGTTRLSEAH